MEAPAEVSVMRGELPRREIEFTIEMESDSEAENVEAEKAKGTEKADSEHEISGIQFRSQFPTPMRRNRLAEITSRINGAK